MNRVIILFFLILASITAFSQGLRLSVFDDSLDKVLLNMHIEISFDNNALSQYKVSANRNFKNPKEAIDFLLKDKPFVCEQINGVYVVSSKKQEFVIPPKKEYFLSGYVSDSETGEKLPFAYLQFNNLTVSTDDKGFFFLKQEDKRSFTINVQYLGYISSDTVLRAGEHHLVLTPKSMSLQTVVVNSPPATMMMQTGNVSGETRINYNIARYMPGSGDNSVFNLLRMMPGVRASGEPSDELIVWGSLGGESRMSFDGFAIYGMKSFNDNISMINPYMVKEIRLQKGGYDASIGNQSGALAKVTGIGGQRDEPSVKANLSNLTANIFGSVPINKKTVLSAAYRQTFYNLYESELLNPYNGKHSSSTSGNGKMNTQSTNTTGTYLLPNYGFRDFNLKFSSDVSNTDNCHISMYGASDKFDFTLKNEDESETEATQNSNQYAIAANYDKIWSNGNSTKLLVSYSYFNMEEDHISIPKGHQQGTSLMHVDNRMQELSFNLEHQFDFGKYQKIMIGTECSQYSNKLNGITNNLFMPSIYAIDNIKLNNLSVSGSLRTDFASSNVLVQPRISSAYSFSENLRATASYGLYNQYVVNNPIKDDNNNVAFVWNVAQSEVLKATHVLVGMAYSKDGLLVSVEGYNKYTRNATRFYKDEIYLTNVDIWGADIFLKKELGMSSLFASYSITDILEKNPETGHEIKLGGILSLSPFYISSNFVYGRGFNVASKGQHGNGQGQNSKIHVIDGNYSRFDLAATYRMELKKCVVQTGLSLINVFGTQNVKYDYSLGGQQDILNVYTQAITFTPMFFIEFLF